MTSADELLRKTSRTFALAIPLLPEPTRSEVKVAYLLFRIIDTFEDAALWLPAQRIAALQGFIDVIDRPPEAEAQQVSEQCMRNPPVNRADYMQLLSEIPFVVRAYQALAPEARRHIRTHLGRTARGMSEFVARSNGSGHFQLETLDDLRDYCYVVAGIVGEMLTELYVLDWPQLQSVVLELRARAARFGEGLQLVNILKDARPDADEGRIYLPRGARLDEVFAVARDDLNEAGTYTDLLRGAGAPPGLVAFNALIMALGMATMAVLRRHGLGAKLTRLEVANILAQVTRDPSAQQPDSAAL